MLGENPDIPYGGLKRDEFQNFNCAGDPKIFKNFPVLYFQGT
jgi:hypothetical protein